MLSIYQARSSDELLQARALFEEYAASLGIDLCFQGFEEELATLPGYYARPDGRLLLASWHTALAGCVALRRLERDVCEMKRLYVRPPFRALGIGRSLAERIIEEAGQAGYTRMRLDSLPTMAAATTLYRQLGFHEIPPYRDNRVRGTVFLELQLKGRLGDS
jgi:putative acetyltransferase